jgi:hypothetical protein
MARSHSKAKIVRDDVRLACAVLADEQRCLNPAERQKNPAERQKQIHNEIHTRGLKFLASCLQQGTSRSFA